MINKIILMGNICQDPILKTGVKDNKKWSALRFSLAVDQGNETTMFLPVVIWNKLAESAAKFLKKGDKIVVDGQLDADIYESVDGPTKIIKINVDKFELIHHCNKKCVSKDETEEIKEVR